MRIRRSATTPSALRATRAARTGGRRGHPAALASDTTNNCEKPGRWPSKGRGFTERQRPASGIMTPKAVASPLPTRRRADSKHVAEDSRSPPRRARAVVTPALCNHHGRRALADQATSQGRSPLLPRAQKHSWAQPYFPDPIRRDIPMQAAGRNSRTGTSRGDSHHRGEEKPVHAGSPAGHSSLQARMLDLSCS